MFNCFIEDKGFCRSYAVDKRISNNINAQEKEELLCQFFFNMYLGKIFSEEDIVKKEMFLKEKEEDGSVSFIQFIAFEGSFLSVKLFADKTEQGYEINQIRFDRLQEQANKEEETEIEQTVVEEKKERFHEGDSASKMRFVEATQRRNTALEYCNVEKIDTTKYNDVLYGKLKGLFYYIDSNNSIKVIDTINKQRPNEMVANTTLEATLWLLGYEQEYITLATHEENIVNVICDTARQSKDIHVLKSIQMMNQKMFNDALRENPVADEII